MVFRVSHSSYAGVPMPNQNEHNDSREGSENEPISKSLKTYIDEQIKKAYDTDQDPKKKRWKHSWRSASPITRGTFLLTFSAAFATVAYAVIAAFQLSAMRDTNIYAVRAKRPWVGMVGSLVLTKVGDGPHPTIEYTTDVRNFGGSPAFSVIPLVNLVIGDVGTDIKPEIEKACKQLDQNLVPLKVGEMVFPGDDYSFPTEASLDTSPKLHGLNPNSPIYFFPGCIAYLDGEGAVHHTSICRWTDATTFKMGSKFSSCSRQSAD
jgi:hypothetical protein